MADLQQLEEQIVGLSLLDAAQLVKKLEERLGVSAAAAAPVGEAPATNPSTRPAKANQYSHSARSLRYLCVSRLYWGGTSSFKESMIFSRNIFGTR